MEHGKRWQPARFIHAWMGQHCASDALLGAYLWKLEVNPELLISGAMKWIEVVAKWSRSGHEVVTKWSRSGREVVTKWSRSKLSRNNREIVKRIVKK